MKQGMSAKRHQPVDDKMEIQPMKKQKKMDDPEIINLECGAEVYWVKPDAFGDYSLKVKKMPNPPYKDNGSPWNMMTLEEDTMVREKQPRDRKPCNLGSLMYDNVLTKEELPDKLTDALCCSCYGIFSVTKDRKSIIKMYHDIRNKIHNESDMKEICRLVKDPNDLINDIENGYTVVLVFGTSNFYEQYFFKVKDIYMMVKIDHTIGWDM